MNFVSITSDNQVATITLKGPHGNRINFEMRSEIYSAIEQIEASDARVLILKGDGSDFCLGGDVRDWPGMNASELRPRLEVFGRAIDLLEKLTIPTIAAVQGGCMGGGFELVLGCDIVVAAETARFMFPEALVGIMTLQGGVYRFAERVGRRKALELVFLPEPIDARQMADWDVINRVVSDADLDTTVQRIAERLRDGPTETYKRTKQLMRIWETTGRGGARAALYDLSMPLFDSPSVQAALRAAADSMNGRKPISTTQDAHD